MTIIPSEDGSTVEEFDGQGRHLLTRSGLTDEVLLTFHYDEDGLLVGLEDGDGNLTEVERGPDGLATAVVSPFGQRTELTYDPDGWLETATAPGGLVYTADHQASGLLERFTGPAGNEAVFGYDGEGRMVLHDDPGDGQRTLSRVELDPTEEIPFGYRVTVGTALGRESVYTVEHHASGLRRHVSLSPSGETTVLETSPDGTEEVTYPDGTLVSRLRGPVKGRRI